MLEKIGLPSRSSQGTEWVIDSSSCRTCQSPFTLFNRKHHCRRCGDLFCNNCTQQRMVLPGQGASPVRICDPCKRSEEEILMELKRGNKSRKAKGSSKLAEKSENELLQELSGDAKHLLKYASYDLQGSRSKMAGSSMHEMSGSSEAVEDIIRSVSSDDNGIVLNEVSSSNPEELRKLAQEEKNKHKTLKSQGKPNEALAAFKRGKELERQAEALEIAMRKSRRLASINKTSKPKVNSELPSQQRQKSTVTRKPKRDDLANELRELGWSEADLHEAEKKPEKQSLESELSSLLGDSHSQKIGGSIDKTQVIAHKKKALDLKREGKLAEAKEELKLAKILEKQLEEQEFLAGAEESDDEISTLIRSLDDDKHNDLSIDDIRVHNMNLDFSKLGDDFSLEANFDVTDDDMNDPEIAAALKSFGWNDQDAHVDGNAPDTALLDHKGLNDEILSLKREAVKQKKAGNLSLAMDILKKAKQLEKELESFRNSVKQMEVSVMQDTSLSQFPGNTNANVAIPTLPHLKQPQMSKVVIQRELLGLKRKALALKREGRVEEAEEELRKGKVLELQLEELEKVPQLASTKEENLGNVNEQVRDSHLGEHMHLDLDDADDADVTDKDMEDPALLSVLKNLGWKDDSEMLDSTKETLKFEPPVHMMAVPDPLSSKPMRSKAEIQKELLAIKRKALVLRRQGKTEEAEQELRKAGDLENQLKEVDSKHQVEQFTKAHNSFDFLHSGSSRISSEIPQEETEVKQQPEHLKIADNIESSIYVESSKVFLEAMKGTGVKDDINSLTVKINTPEKVKDGKEYGGFHPENAGKMVGEMPKELLLMKSDAEVPREHIETLESNEELRKAMDTETQIEAAIVNNSTGHLKKRNEQIGSMHWEGFKISHDISKDEENENVFGFVNNKESTTAGTVQLNSQNYLFVEPPAASAKIVRNRAEVEKELSLVKKEAIDFVQQGKIVEAQEVLQKAKDLENELDTIEKCLATSSYSEPLVTGALIAGNERISLASQDVMHMDPSHGDTSLDTSYDGVSPITKSAVGKSSDGQYAAENVALNLPSGKPQTTIYNDNVNLTDFLTGDDWIGKSFLPNKLDENLHPSYLPADYLNPIEADLEKKIAAQSPVQSFTETIQVGHQHSLDVVSQRKDEDDAPIVKEIPGSETTHAVHSIKDQIIAHKRRAVALKREGKLAEAREELKQAKILERSLDGDDHQANEDNKGVDVSNSVVIPPQKATQERSSSPQKPVSSRDRFRLQQESLSKKRLALKLRRDGKIDEADMLLEQAKNLEAQIEELDSLSTNKTVDKGEDDALVEDFLDPQLLSALQSIGIGVEKQKPNSKSQQPIKPERNMITSNIEPKATTDSGKLKTTTASSTSLEKAQLEEQIKQEKVRALNFKRAGKQAEALESLRSAKRLEKKLASLG